MNKNILNKIASSLFLISTLLFAACTGLSENNYIEEMATISVSIAETDSEARLIKATPKITELTDIVLTGTKSGGSAESLGSWASYAALSNATIKIPTGSWSFTLTCKKGTESFTGTTNATISTGANTLSFNISHVTSASTPSTGSARGTIQYPQGVTAQTVILDIKYNNTSIHRVIKPANEIQNNSIEIEKDNLAPGRYAFDIVITKMIITDEAGYNTFMNSLASSNSQLQQLTYNELVAYEQNTFEIEAGLTTDISQNLSYLTPEVQANDKGFKSVRALTDADGKGYIEFVVKWPKQISYANGDSTASENTNAIEICRDGNTILSYSYWGSDPHPSTIVLCDRYELTAGQEYTYKLRYNFKWQSDTEFEYTVTASANGLTKPNIVCPNTSFNGTTLTCTNLNESDLQLNTRVTQAERNRISRYAMQFNYYDPEQPNDWGDTRIYTGFEYSNTSTGSSYLWTSARSGVTRKIYHAQLNLYYETLYGTISREFHIADGYDNVKAWAGNKLADTLVFATSSGN